MALAFPSHQPASAPRSRDDYTRLQDRCAYLEDANERLSETVATQTVEITRLQLELLRLRDHAACPAA